METEYVTSYAYDEQYKRLASLLQYTVAVVSPGTSQVASALAFISKPSSAYTWVVLVETCPNQALMMLTSTPARCKKNCSGMAQRVRTDAFARLRRDDNGGFLSTTLD